MSRQSVWARAHHIPTGEFARPNDHLPHMFPSPKALLISLLSLGLCWPCLGGEAPTVGQATAVPDSTQVMAGTKIGATLRKGETLRTPRAFGGWYTVASPPQGHHMNGITYEPLAAGNGSPQNHLAKVLTPPTASGSYPETRKALRRDILLAQRATLTSRMTDRYERWQREPDPTQKASLRAFYEEAKADLAAVEQELKQAPKPDPLRLAAEQAAIQAEREATKPQREAMHRRMIEAARKAREEQEKKERDQNKNSLDLLSLLLTPQQQESCGLQRLSPGERLNLQRVLLALASANRLETSALEYLKSQGWEEVTVLGTRTLALNESSLTEEYLIVENGVWTYILEPRTFVRLRPGRYLADMGLVSCSIIGDNGSVVPFWTKDRR